MQADDPRAKRWNPPCEHRPGMPGCTLNRIRTPDGEELRCRVCGLLRHFVAAERPDLSAHAHAYRALRYAWHARAWR